MEAQRDSVTAPRLCRKSVVGPRIGVRRSISAPQPQDLYFLPHADVTATVAGEERVELCQSAALWCTLETKYFSTNVLPTAENLIEGCVC